MDGRPPATCPATLVAPFAKEVVAPLAAAAVTTSPPPGLGPAPPGLGPAVAPDAVPEVAAAPEGFLNVN